MTNPDLALTAPAPSSTIKVWDLPLRLFHWALVAAIAAAFLSSDKDSALAGWHIAAGWTAAVLIGFRLVWGFAGGEHARFASFLRPSRAWTHLRGLVTGRVERTLGHNPAGALAVLALLGMVAVVVAAGYQALSGGGEELHETAAWLLLGLIAVHVVAVIATSVMTRENLVRAMVTGRKRAADHPGARPARRASLLGIVLALGAAAATTAAILAADPQAFSLTAREGSEAGEAGEAGERD